jgi:hypothetical protein
LKKFLLRIGWRLQYNPDGMTGSEYFAKACTVIPQLERLRRTPETECGDAVLFSSDHVAALIDAVSTIATTELLVGGDIPDPLFRLAYVEALRMIKVSPHVFFAYAFMHDIAKPDRLMLIADSGSSGEAHGFVRRQSRAHEYTTTSERDRFIALREAGSISGVHATFDDADRAVIAPQYAELREAIVRFCQLDTAHVKFVTELCWSHRDVLELFREPGNESAYAIFPARAGKSGLNCERFLDSLFTLAWLEGGKEAVYRLASAEYAVAPDRHAARIARDRHEKKMQFKEILQKAELDPETLFAELKIPPGPIRGETMNIVYQMIRGNALAAESFGDHAEVMWTRACRAAELLKEDGFEV